MTTTLRVPIQQAAATALGDRYGGVVVLERPHGRGRGRCRPGHGRAAAARARRSRRSPSAAALTAGKTTLDTTYPYARFALLNGWKLHNFHHEDCGGSLVLAFAVSCNSVFGAAGGLGRGAASWWRWPTRSGSTSPPSIAYPVPESVTRPASDMTSTARPGRRRHRPGRRRRDAAADGLGGADDRVGLHPQAAVPDPAAAARPASRTRRCGRARARSQPR